MRLAWVVLFCAAPACALVFPLSPARRRRALVGGLRAAPRTKGDGRRKIIANNRKARFDYEILRNLECGIQLRGTEVKSCRDSKASIVDGFARVEKGTCWLYNVDIAAHGTTGEYFQHETRARRRLLLHKAEIRKLSAETDKQGLTLVPLSMYFNDRNLLKVDLALCKGKNTRDKRQDIKGKEEKRMLSRLSKNMGI